VCAIVFPFIAFYNLDRDLTIGENMRTIQCYRNRGGLGERDRLDRTGQLEYDRGGGDDDEAAAQAVILYSSMLTEQCCIWWLCVVRGAKINHTCFFSFSFSSCLRSLRYS